MDVVVLLALGASIGFAAAAVLKHASAAELPHLDRFTVPGLARLMVETVRHRMWLAGAAVDVVAVVLHVLALRDGALAVVQPLLVSTVVFGLLIRSAVARQLRRRELGWAVTLTAALAGFLLVAGSAAPVDGADVDRGPAAVVAVVGAVIAAACIAAARGRFAHGAAAAAFGVAAGITYAASAALLKALTPSIDLGPVAVLGRWQLYAVLACAVVGMLVTQLAYQAGPLAASLPAITVVNPVVSILVGLLVYDEDIRHGIGASLTMAALLVVLGWSVYRLTLAEDDAPVPQTRL